MATRKRRMASTVDLTFLRGIVVDNREISELRKMVVRHIQLLRITIVKRVETALYRRYNSYTKNRKERPTYLEWLHEKGALHETYAHHSYDTRMYWSTRSVVHASRASLSYQLDLEAGTPGDNSWFFQLLEQFINERVPDAPKYLRVRKLQTGRVPGETQPAFELKRRPRTS